MCGRYVSATPVEELARYFDAAPDDDLAEVGRARYNVPPTEQVLGVVAEAPENDRAQAEDGDLSAAERRIRSYRWGLVPSWAKDLAAGNRAFNARAESLVTRPAFRSAFRSRRLLVPATAFYEWQRAAARRQPFAFRRSDGAPLAFAGLWELWRNPADGKWLRSLTIVTTEAGPDVAAVHDRQPVVVDPGDFDPWLAPGAIDAQLAARVLAPSPSGTLVAYPVDPAVGNTANDSPRLFEPVEA